MGDVSRNVSWLLYVYGLVRDVSDVGVAEGAGFAELYRAEWPRLVRLALILTGSREVAEDLVQDAFVRYAASRRGVARPAAYLRSSVVNLPRPVPPRESGGEAPERDPGVWADPEIDETAWALRSLPERYRSALVLRFYADLPVAEVAAMLGCRTGTARVR
jgi:DNA-directed RNA polymerase specialized sigma24 family protein